MQVLAKILLFASLFAACQTSRSRISSDKLEGMSENVAGLWRQHIEHETRGKLIQPDCMPRFYAADTAVPRRGIVMFFHGFTACPQQYFNIAETLSRKGFDVFLPLMPGQGRQPSDGPKGDKDNHDDLPSTEHKGGKFVDEYQDGDDENDRLQYFVKSMNEIAAATAGERIIAGLSGGAGLATGAAVAGQGIWNRVLLYSPYYKNPGFSGLMSAFLDQVMPGFVNDWGPDCRANRRSEAGRAGLCSLTIGAVRAMTNYGVNAVKRIGEIKVPVQFVGVVADPTADNGTIHAAFNKIADRAQICLYPKGVPHSLINPKADAPKLDPYWVPALREESINFIVEGKWFRHASSVASAEDYSLPICRHAL